MSNTSTNNRQKTLDKRIIRSKKAIRDAFFAELVVLISFHSNDLLPVESLFEEIETELINKFRPLFSTLDLKSTTFSARSFFNEFSKLARDDF